MGSDVCAPGTSHAAAVAALRDAGIRYLGIDSGAAGLSADMARVGIDTGSVSARTGRPFVYAIASDGTGLSTTVADGIADLSGSVPVRVEAVARDDASDTVDAVAAFVDHVDTNTTGTSVHGRLCTPGLRVADGDGDGAPDHYPAVLPGTSVCFDIVARPNDSVPAAAEPQLFHATVDVLGDRSTPLDARDVYFVVPPEVPPPGLY